MEIKLSKRQARKFNQKHPTNNIATIPNTFVYYGMPLTCKSTILFNIASKDAKQYHLPDLAINLWTFLHTSKKYPTHTEPYIQARNKGYVKAIELPYDYMQWGNTLSKYKASHPQIARVLIDEGQCIPSAVLLDALIMTIRSFYPNVQVIISTLDFDSWHHKFQNINSILAMVSDSKHLDHVCMVHGCKKIATRRLHLIDGKPAYNEKQYDKALAKHERTHNHHKFDMISTCSKHYRHPIINGHQF